MYRTILYSTILFVSACGASTGEAGEKKTGPEAAANVVMLTPQQISNGGIVVGTPTEQALPGTIRVSGVAETPPERKVTISFPFGGYVSSTALLPGMQVRRGHVLAVLQDPQFVQMQQDYLLSRSRLQFLEKEYERQRTLNVSKTTSDKVFEQTASDYRAERIQAEALRQKLQLLGINPNALHEGNISRTVNLYAPISGFVSVVNVNRGKYVSPTDVLFELVDPADLHLSLTVFEQDLPRIRPGQQVDTWLTSDTTQRFAASVHYVGKALDAGRSTVVHCDFKSAVPQLLPGMFLNAAIRTEGIPAVTVPEDAVVRFGAGTYIFREQRPGTFSMVPVQTGIRSGGQVQLTSVQPGLLQQRIILKNAYAALMQLQSQSAQEAD